MGRLDLHTHSCFSDGRCTPEELLALAARPELELTAVALTDHDTVAGIPRFLAAAKKHPELLAIPGVELSTRLNTREIHVVGLFVEVKTPGFGVPGILGICAVVLYFIGQIAVGASEWGPMVIFFIGVVLLALEIFLIPGFGLVGVLGGICVLGSMVAAFGFDNLETAVQVVGGGLVAALLIITVLVMYVLPKTALFRRFALAEAVGRDSGQEAAQAEALAEQEAGALGKAISPLRPSGTVELSGKRFDAVTEGDFIDAGCEVQVVGKRNFQLIVRKI